jgi:hypothetical protein
MRKHYLNIKNIEDLLIREKRPPEKVEEILLEIEDGKYDVVEKDFTLYVETFKGNKFEVEL